jgi:hypothetical protein
VDSEPAPTTPPRAISSGATTRRLYAACHGNVTHIAQRAGKQRYTVREALRAIGLVAPSSDADGDAEADDRAVPEPKRWNSGGRSSGKRDP